MANKKALKASDRTLKDLRGNGQLFGVAFILLSGDFRRTLPLMLHSTPADQFQCTFQIISSMVNELTLKTNICVFNYKTMHPPNVLQKNG